MTGRARARAGALAAALALAVWAAAGPAGAAAFHALRALSAAGDRAVIVEDGVWTEAALTGALASRRLAPPPGCDWSAAAYAPAGDALALAAFCDRPDDCARAEARLYLWPAGADRPALTAAASGRRWGDIHWRAGRDEVLAVEATLSPPRIDRLSDIGSLSAFCARETGALAVIDLVRRARIGLDILPPGWGALSLVAADAAAITAELRVSAGLADPPPEAAAALARMGGICAEAAPPRPHFCRVAGGPAMLTWRDGEWRLRDPVATGRARLLLAPAAGVEGRETCVRRRVRNRVTPECRFAFFRDGAPLADIAAPGGLFGDVALSADGRIFVALAGRPGLPDRRFDLFDLSTGEARSLGRLLSRPPPGLPGRSP